MKELIKDYGALFGPILAFLFGVAAVYIKFHVDRILENKKTIKKLSKLITMIERSPPPIKFHKVITNNTFTPDHVRNLTNMAIFRKRLHVLKSIIDKIEGEVLVNCSIVRIHQFHNLKILIEYTHKKVERLIDKEDKVLRAENPFVLDAISESDFQDMKRDYDRILNVCKNPESDFNYSDS